MTTKLNEILAIFTEEVEDLLKSHFNLNNS